MAEFSELIRDFDKIRDYMRDFYIYGFRSRNEFDKKSARSYDNEKRRIESYLEKYIQWSYNQNGKQTFVALNSAQISENPLYAAWRAKSFTDYDIMLHFGLMDLLRNGDEKNAGQLTEEVSRLLDVTFDLQTVRGKCREYEKAGIFKARRQGKAILYSLSPDTLPEHLADAVSFFTEAAPFGEIGSFLLQQAKLKNNYFRFKHHFIVHTLEDGVLLELLRAMREECWVELVNFSEKHQNETLVRGVPLKIFSSVVTGRRYVCLYQTTRRQYTVCRLDYIRSVKKTELCSCYHSIAQQLQQELPLLWGVSLQARRKHILCMKLYIQEQKESYVLERLHREGRGGEILRLEENIFLYTIELYDIGEASSWIKTFTGRILALEGSDPAVIGRFYRDMERMKKMYLETGETSPV